MTSRDGLITALRCWAGEIESLVTKEGCTKIGCPYADGECGLKATTDALAYIRQLEAEKNTMQSYIDAKNGKAGDNAQKEQSAVNHPSHYNTGKVEVIDAIDEWGLNFARGNAVKYIARAGHKANECEDLEKALWYIQHEIDRLRF